MISDTSAIRLRGHENVETYMTAVIVETTEDTNVSFWMKKRMIQTATILAANGKTTLDFVPHILVFDGDLIEIRCSNNNADITAMYSLQQMSRPNPKSWEIA